MDMTASSYKNPSHTPVLLKGGYARTPFARAGARGRPGQLGALRQDELAALTINEIVRRTGIDPSHVHQVIAGCAFPEGRNGLNVARNIVLHPECVLDQASTAGKTVNMFCASAMTAFHEAVNAISGRMNALEHPVFIVGGMEDMTNNPGMLGYKPSFNPRTAKALPEGALQMLDTAENLQKIYGISRRDQEKFAVESHLRAARSGNFLAGEIVPVPVERAPEGHERVRFQDNGGPSVRVVDRDDLIQDYGTAEAGLKEMREMRTVQPNGTVTAATSSPFTDGVAFMIVTSEAYAIENGLPIQAEVLACAQSACAPETMGIGPVKSSLMALAHAGLRMDDIDAIEGNEAFAAQIMAVCAELEKLGVPVDPEKLNMHGGALAIGHPLGASGARLVGTLGRTLDEYGMDHGLATMCVGGGMGAATVLKRYAPMPA